MKRSKREVIPGDMFMVYIEPQTAELVLTSGRLLVQLKNRTYLARLSNWYIPDITEFLTENYELSRGNRCLYKKREQ